MRIEGVVIRGNGIGRKLNVPTANIKVAPDAPITNGVYSARVTLDEGEFAAVVNVGYKPTVDSHAARGAEVHLLDFVGDLYGRRISVELGEYLRSESRFESVEELRAQIQKDIDKVKNQIKE